MIDEEIKQKAVFIAQNIVNESIGLVDGCRQIVSLRLCQEIRDDPDFLTIRGFESETDEFPIGEVRKHYNQEALKKLDTELNSYVARVKPIIISACENIIKKYSV